MSDATTAPLEELLAPVDFFVVEFPRGEMAASGFDTLSQLEQSGVIAILDVEFVAVDDDGVVSPAAAGDLADGRTDLAAFADANAGLLDEDDLAMLAERLRPGSTAVVVVYENVWATGILDGWRSDGAVVIANGGLHPDEVVTAFSAPES